MNNYIENENKKLADLLIEADIAILERALFEQFNSSLLGLIELIEKEGKERISEISLEYYKWKASIPDGYVYAGDPFHDFLVSKLESLLSSLKGSQSKE